MKRIISGGQAGVDQAALHTAKALGIPTGGWAPKGWRTETGAAPWLADFGLREGAADYASRTFQNVEDSQATLLIGRADSPGSKCTLRACHFYGRHVCVVAPCDLERGSIAPVHDVRAWIAKYAPETLNVAGHRESVYPGIGDLTRVFLYAVLSPSSSA